MEKSYHARDTRLGRDVALKLLLLRALGDASARALDRVGEDRFLANHPNICTIHDVGESDSQTYVALECGLQNVRFQKNLWRNYEKAFQFKSEVLVRACPHDP